jgi:hypothetical protein
MVVPYRVGPASAKWALPVLKEAAILHDRVATDVMLSGAKHLSGGTVYPEILRFAQNDKRETRFLDLS